MWKNTARLVVLGAGLAFAAAPAFAADMPAKKAPAHHAMHHGMSCYDYAWQSQTQKDCLARPMADEHKPMAHHARHHRAKKPMEKPMMDKKS